MAKKSTNTQGNPWHDESTGEFTSQNGGGAQTSQDEESRAMKLLKVDGGENYYKKGDDLSPTPPTPPLSNKLKDKLDRNKDSIARARGRYKQVDDYRKKGLEKGSTLKECEQIGTNLLGSGVVAYSNVLSVEAANQFNQALFDIKQTFPKLMESLARYGTGSLTIDEIRQIRSKSIERYHELAKSMNIMTDDEKQWVGSYINEVLGEDKYTSDIYSVTQERIGSGQPGLYGYYHPSVISKEMLNKQNNIRADILVGESTGGFYRSVQTRDSLVGLSTVQVNPYMFSKENMPELTDDMSGYEFTREGKGKAYVAGSHELGHFVDIMFANNFLSREELAERKQLLVAYQNSREASKYSRTNYNESAAEAISDFFGNTDPIKEGVAYVDFLKRMYHKYFDDGGGAGDVPANNGNPPFGGQVAMA